MDTPESTPQESKPKLTWYLYIWIGWPIVLVGIGGAIGGACGGLAWAINQKVFRTTQNPIMRYLWTGLISIAAIVVYFFAARFFLSLIQSGN